jgi:Mg-chelatase subunit ChlD
LNAWLPLEFDRPGYLFLLAALPLGWWWGRRALAALGTGRGAAAFGLRTLVWLLIVAACAELQWVRTDDKLSVVYLLDRSLSVPEAERRSMVEYVNRATAAQRKDRDAVGAIVFGREAQVESPPLTDDLRLHTTLAAPVDPRHTNLADALKLARASFPSDAAKRVVIVSDGNQNVGDAYDEARRAADQGIGIDVVPVTYQARGDVAVEKVTLPSVARRGEPFDVQILMQNTVEAAATGGGTVAGTLELLRRRGDETAVLSRERIELPPGKRPFTLRQTLEDPDFYVFEARFTPDDAKADAQPQNNRALNFTQLMGSGRILFIENAEHRGEHERLIAALRQEKFDVTVMPSNRLFTAPGDLIPYDTVVLADVPKSGGDVDSLAAFSDEQMQMLAANTREMGCGLVLLGGPNSFGAGGWANTPVEEAMPVDFQIKNVEVVPNGALMLVLDCSGSMAGEKLEMSKVAAIAAVKVLGPRDYAGVVAFDSVARWIVRLQPMRSVADVVSRLRLLGPGGGTNMRPGMDQGYAALTQIEAGIKHMIVMTDGMTEGTGYAETAARMRKVGITTSCIALGTDAAVPLLDSIAQAGGGKFYAVNHPQTIPRIFVNEARRIARPLIVEEEAGFVPVVEQSHDVLRPVARPLAPLYGFVMTSVKPSSLVQVLAVHPKYRAEGTGTIAATWTYGLGRTAVWTSDCGRQWARDWNARTDFDPLLTGMIRWTMRPPTGADRFAIATEAQAGRGRVLVTALDDRGDFLNLLDPQGSVVGPDLKSRPIRLEQTAPGRYAATFAADEVGSYFVVVRPGPGEPLLRAGVNVTYSSEFSDRTANESLLASLAALRTSGGVGGRLAPPLRAGPTPANDTAAVAPVDFFRHDLPPARGRRDLWPQLVLAALAVFVGDVFVRRVAFEWSWLMLPFTWVASRWRSNRGRIVAPQYLERLQSRKEAIHRDVADRRAVNEVRLPPQTTKPSPPRSVPTKPAATATPAASSIEPAGPPTSASSPEDYTSRLLAAKRRAAKSPPHDPSKKPSDPA